MKLLASTLITIVTVVIALAYNSNVSETIKSDSLNSTSSIEIPSQVKVVLDKSCTMCHNSDSKNTKGKLKLNFDNFSNGDYSKGKLIGKLNGISKVITKNDMPPKKFVEKYPERAPSAEELKLVKDWVAKEITALSAE